jgi:hypothetical protein
MTPAQPSPQMKPSLVKSTLSAITSLTVFKTQQNGKLQQLIAIPSLQPSNMAQLSTTINTV